MQKFLAVVGGVTLCVALILVLAIHVAQAERWRAYPKAALENLSASTNADPASATRDAAETAEAEVKLRRLVAQRRREEAERTAAEDASARAAEEDARLRAERSPPRRWVPPVVEQRVARVWVPAVTRTVTDRVYEPPVYRTEHVWQWREAEHGTTVERTFVPDLFKPVDVVGVDRCGRQYVERRLALVSSAHYERVERDVVVRAGGWEDVEQQVVAREGGYHDVRREEVLRPAHYETRTEQVEVAAGHWE